MSEFIFSRLLILSLHEADYKISLNKLYLFGLQVKVWLWRSCSAYLRAFTSKAKIQYNPICEGVHSTSNGGGCPGQQPRFRSTWRHGTTEDTPFLGWHFQRWAGLRVWVVLKYGYFKIGGKVTLYVHVLTWKRTWWHNQMKTFSALLALCAGNIPVTG